MPEVVDEKVRARAVQLVQEHRAEYPTVSKALEAVARQEGAGKESLRRWGDRVEVDAGTRQGATSDELAEIKKLKAENKRLLEDVATLKAATHFFVAELDPATDDARLHQRPASPGVCGRDVVGARPVDLSGPAGAGVS